MLGRLVGAVRDVEAQRLGRQSPPRLVLRLALAAFLATAGVGHFVATETFLAQVPAWMPFEREVVLVSGVVELVLAAAVALASSRRTLVALVVVTFLHVVLPGNIAQWLEGVDAFGLDTDRARLLRLVVGHPLLVLWALAAGDVWPAPRRSVAV
ncbi:MAG: hypothetical protein RLZZ353_1253 [Actinomycetota bacterium]